MDIYLIIVHGLLSNSVRVSQEAYATFEEAEAFIMTRSGNPEHIRPDDWFYQTSTNVYYEIKLVTVKK